MSTTSCPRCRGQVTLPVGASNTSRVRCPLCHAHYTLAEALVNMPPLLEVVDDANIEDASFAFDEPTPTEPALASPLADETIEFAAEEALDDELQDELPEEAEADAGDLTYSSSGAPTVDLPLTVQPAEAGSEDEATAEDEDDALDFGPPQAALAAESNEPAGGDDDMTLDFGAQPSSDAAEGETVQFEESGDEMELDFGEPQPAATGEAATLDFGPPQSDDSSDDVQFDFDEPRSAEATTVEFASEEIQFADDEPREQAAGAQGLGEFGDVQFEATGEGDDIPLDLPAEAAAAPTADESEAEDASGKKKRKQKKQKAAGEKQPRSLAGTLARAVVSLLVAVPIALYVAMWISPGLDVVGLGDMLPSAMVPSGYKKYKAEQLAKNQPPAKGVDFAALAASANFRPPADAADDAEPTDTDEPAADAPPTLEPGVEHEGDAPAADDPFAPAPEEMPEDAAAPADDPFGEPQPSADDPFAPAETAAEPAAEADPFAPAEKANAAADDPFAPDEPAKEPTEPANEPTEPTADDPFADPPARSDEPPAAESPVTRPAAPESPLESPAAAEGAADDADPFATPAAPDMPAPADQRPSDDIDDLFAPDKPADKPAEAETLPAPDAPAAPAKMLGPRNAPQLTLPQVMGTMQATQAAGQQLAAAEAAGDEAALSKARANFYVTLFDMAGALTLGQLGPGAAQLDPQLQALEPMIREQLTADPKQFESLKLFGARWFAFPKRTNNGVVLGGTVESVDHAGDLYHTRINPGKAEAASVTIVSAKDPQVAAGDEVLTLGSIVERPQDQLAGYEGNEPAVVWSGMTMKISPPGH